MAVGFSSLEKKTGRGLAGRLLSLVLGEDIYMKLLSYNRLLFHELLFGVNIIATVRKDEGTAISLVELKTYTREKACHPQIGVIITSVLKPPECLRQTTCHPLEPYSLE